MQILDFIKKDHIIEHKQVTAGKSGVAMRKKIPYVYQKVLCLYV